MFKSSKWRIRTVLASMVCALLLSVGAMPANAAVVRNVSVGYSSSVVALTSYQDISGKTVSVSYGPQFSNHAFSSVYVSSFQVCFSITGGGPTLLKPQVRDANTIYADFGYVTMESGTCRWFSLNRTFYAAPGNELFRIVGTLGGNGGPEGVTVGGFYR